MGAAQRTSRASILSVVSPQSPPPCAPPCHRRISAPGLLGREAGACMADKDRCDTVPCMRVPHRRASCCIFSHRKMTASLNDSLHRLQRRRRRKRKRSPPPRTHAPVPLVHRSRRGFVDPRRGHKGRCDTSTCSDVDRRRAAGYTCLHRSVSLSHPRPARRI